MIYLVDTNVFRVLESYYPTSFPRFWAALQNLVDRGEFRSVDEVLNEIKLGSPPSHMSGWIESNKIIFALPTSEELEFVAQIFKVDHFQQLIGRKQRLQGTPVADPFLIAAAKINNGCVITEERPKPNSAKIPSVCQYFGIPCITLEQMLAEQRWSF